MWCGSRCSARHARERQRLVRVAPIARDLPAEPGRRGEAVALLGRGELDLGDEQALVRLVRRRRSRRRARPRGRGGVASWRSGGLRSAATAPRTATLRSPARPRCRRLPVLPRARSAAGGTLDGAHRTAACRASRASRGPSSPAQGGVGFHRSGFPGRRQRRSARRGRSDGGRGRHTGAPPASGGRARSPHRERDAGSHRISSRPAMSQLCSRSWTPAR